jgi:hypothetical protein
MTEAFLNKKEQMTTGRESPGFIDHPSLRRRGKSPMNPSPIRGKPSLRGVFEDPTEPSLRGVFKDPTEPSLHRGGKTPIKKQNDKILLIAAEILVNMHLDTGRYNYLCPKKCFKLINCKWNDRFRPRLCPGCLSLCRPQKCLDISLKTCCIVQTSVRHPCMLCKNQHCNAIEFITHTMFGKCSDDRENAIVVSTI